MIINKKVGQLGNRIFYFAHCIATAIETGDTVCNLAFDEYAKYFKTTGNDLFCRYPPKRSIYPFGLLRKILYYFSRGTNKFNLEDINDALIQKHSDEIKRYFEPVDSIQTNVKRLIDKSRKQGDILIGLHIRRGDYKKYCGGKYYYSIKDYTTKMHDAERLFNGKRVSFLICSNNIWRSNGNLFDGHSITFGTHHLVEDMYSLAQCDYIIGPPSTYSMWASFYGNVPIYIIKNIKDNIIFQSRAL